ncbi:hypothetical protein F8M41_008659 [Gigaspora margarita]|uniref:Uncharacterized protein n=1 Tax=Gigaspora margarita TaxID=4874 RepID=A0A8H4A3L8_GIGMA|nr:hypothetical protein F8M41_008659 [Gigaspora margarita]
MSDIKYLFYPHTFANFNSLSKHITIYVKNAKATGQIIANNSAHICNNSKPIKSVKQKQKYYVNINKYYSNSDINEYYSNSEFSAKTLSFKNINFHKVLKHNKTIEINSNIDLNSIYAGPLGVSNTDNISDEFAYTVCF